MTGSEWRYIADFQSEEVAQAAISRLPMAGIGHGLEKEFKVEKDPAYTSRWRVFTIYEGRVGTVSLGTVKNFFEGFRSGVCWSQNNQKK